MFDGLKTFAPDVPSFYADASSSARDNVATLTRDATFTRKAERRQHLNGLRVANVVKQLTRLPEPGESIHGIARGNFDMFDLIPAVAELGGTIARLDVATLGFNQANAERLIAMLDAGNVGAVTFICSHYYRSIEADVFGFLHGELKARGHRCVAIRCHAKLLLFELADGRCLVNESSANLRSCRNLEQFTLTHDRPLLEFHRGWMAEVIAEVKE